MKSMHFRGGRVAWGVWVAAGLVWIGGVAVVRPVGAAQTGARIGTYEIEVRFTASGSSSASFSDATGSGSWSDDYSFQMTSKVTLEVLQKGTNAVTGAQLSARSTMSVSGGGSSTVSGKNGSYSTSWNYLPPSGFNPESGYASGSYYSPGGRASVSASLGPGMRLDPSDSTGPIDGYLAAVDAANGVGTSFQFEVPRTIEAWSRSGGRGTNVSYTSQFVSASSQGSALIQVQARFQLENRPTWDAILVVDPPLVTPEYPAYVDWVPKGVLREASDFPGNALVVRVHLEPKGGGPGIPPKARYRFTLVGVSREPGILMNFPPRESAGCAAVPEGPFDLRIRPGEDLEVSDEGQHAETPIPMKESSVAVGSHDFGSYGQLRVVAETEDGQTVVAHRAGFPNETFLDIPWDSNGNHVADGWEKELGVFDRSLPASWDGADDPAGQGVKGDGISLYEKYRGFLVLNGQGKEVYERLDPRKKHVFVRNPDRLVREVFVSPEGLPESYMAAAECEVRYVSANGWTGPGTYKDRRRVVNFNCSEDKHAVDQHALHIITVTSPTPSIPADADAVLTAMGRAPSKPLGRRTEGCAYRDGTCPAPSWNQWRPAANFRTEIYTAGVQAYLFDTVLYHTAPACAGCTPEALKDAATDYLESNLGSAGEKYTIELSATITHEMGHGTGVRHHDPVDDSAADNTLRHCTMRYYGPQEYPRNPADRFELEARGNNPDSFCRRKHNCWGHLRISDNLNAEAGSGATLADAPLPGTGSRIHRLANTADPFLPPVPVPDPAAFELSADLAWDDLMEGDPLRFSVRLHGLNDFVARDWLPGLRMRLVRRTPEGREEEVLGPSAWPAFLVPNAFETTSLGVANITRISDWLAPSDRVGLSAGDYRLEIAWHGRGLAPDAGLPPDGILVLAPVVFRVAVPDTAPRQATHQRHLAWERYLVGDLAGALARVQDAERLDPSADDPLALQSRLVGASCAIRMRDALGAARILDGMRAADPSGNHHVAGVASEVFEQLAPRLAVASFPSAGGGGPARLQIDALPGGTYIVQRSPDLMTWTSVSTNTPASAAFEVADSLGTGGAGTGAGRFYRVIWQR